MKYRVSPVANERIDQLLYLCRFNWWKSQIGIERPMVVGVMVPIFETVSGDARGRINGFPYDKYFVQQTMPDDEHRRGT